MSDLYATLNFHCKGCDERGFREPGCGKCTFIEVRLRSLAAPCFLLRALPVCRPAAPL